MNESLRSRIDAAVATSNRKEALACRDALREELRTTRLSASTYSDYLTLLQGVIKPEGTSRNGKVNFYAAQSQQAPEQEKVTPRPSFVRKIMTEVRNGLIAMLTKPLQFIPGRRNSLKRRAA